MKLWDIAGNANELEAMLLAMLQALLKVASNVASGGGNVA